MPALFSLLLSIWALIAPHLVVHQLSGPVPFTDVYGTVRDAGAATSCLNGHADLWLSPSVSLDALVHEAAHAYDCADDGVMNDSPSLRPAVRPAWVSDYCWDSPAEWYACSVVYYRSAHPYLVAPWGLEAMASAGIAPAASSDAPAYVSDQ